MQKYTITPALIRQEYQRRLTLFCLEAPLADILHFFDNSHAYSLRSIDHKISPDDYHDYPEDKQCGRYRSKDGSFTSCGECRLLFKAVSQAVVKRPKLKTLFNGPRHDCPVCIHSSNSQPKNGFSMKTIDEQDQSLSPPITTNELLAQKSQDAETTPGFGASFSPDEAELAGAFVEDALSENDVLDTEELIDEHN